MDGWQQTDNDRQWLYYKLTNEPKGSGELTNNQVLYIVIKRRKLKYLDVHESTLKRLAKKWRQHEKTSNMEYK